MKNTISRRSFLSTALVAGGALSLSGALSGCASDQMADPVPEMSFQHLTPIRLKVGAVHIENHYKSPLSAPNAEHRFTTSPAFALQGWAAARLKAVGSEGNARFLIEDASVIETPLKKTKGLKGAFTTEPTARYDATMKGRLLIRDGEGLKGEVEAQVTRSVEVSEDATLAEREQLWFKMVEDMLKSFDAEMNKQINGYLSRWIVRS